MDQFLDCECCQTDIDERNLIRILNEENELSDKNLRRLKSALEFKRKELVDQSGRVYLTLDSLIQMNNIITNSNNFHLRKVAVRPAGSNKKYMDIYSIEPTLLGLIDTFNLGKIRPKTFADVFLKIHPFLDGNGRTCKVLFMWNIINIQFIYKSFVLYQNRTLALLRVNNVR